jgi:hypothetical protein
VQKIFISRLARSIVCFPFHLLYIKKKKKSRLCTYEVHKPLVMHVRHQTAVLPCQPLYSSSLPIMVGGKCNSCPRCISTFTPAKKKDLKKAKDYLDFSHNKSTNCHCCIDFLVAEIRWIKASVYEQVYYRLHVCDTEWGLERAYNPHYKN